MNIKKRLNQLFLFCFLMLSSSLAFAGSPLVIVIPPDIHDTSVGAPYSATMTLQNKYPAGTKALTITAVNILSSSSPVVSFDANSSTCKLGIPIAPATQCTVVLNLGAPSAQAVDETVSIEYGQVSPLTHEIKYNITNNPPPPSTTDVFTNIIAPNLATSGTVNVKAEGAKTYTHDQAAGTNLFATMDAGSYTITAADYTGTDGKAYHASVTGCSGNQCTIDDQHTNITINYAAPATEAVSTNINAPNLPAGQTVAITLANSAHSYSHNQPAGSSSFDSAVVDGTDYTLTCASYIVDSDTYTSDCSSQSPVTIDSTHTTINVNYTKSSPGANYDWRQPHLNILQDANIFAIWWGGGHTTAPVHIGTNPMTNAWLNSQIASYENGHTSPAKPTAHVKGFPSYIAMGSVSEFTADATSQMQSQKLDIDNHYEGNGDGNAGCAWDNADGYQIPMTVNGSMQATLIKDDATYNIFTDYYSYSTATYTTDLTAPNLPAGQKLNIKLVSTLDSTTYVHNQASGSGVPFDNVLSGTYTVTAASYTGTDGQTYNANVSNPVIVNGGHTSLSLTYSIGGAKIDPSSETSPQPAAIHYYDGTITSIENTQGSNYLVTVEFSEVPIHSNPNLSLVKQQKLPAGATITYKLTAPNIDRTITGQVNLNVQSDGLCHSIWYNWGGYAPQVHNIAEQARSVKGTNSHNLIAGNVVYTERNSDSFDNMTDDVTNDYSITFYLYNLMVEAKLMENEYQASNPVNMVLLLNPDSTNAFQNCGQYYCPFIWETGLTTDSINKVIVIPNLKDDLNKAVARMASNMQFNVPIDDGTVNNILKPSDSGRTQPGVPELTLLQNYLIKLVAPDVPFGYGQNIYDNANPLMAVGTPPIPGAPWETGSVDWLHKVNMSTYSSVKDAAIQFEAAKYAKYLKDMHYSSYPQDPFAQYAPDFIYYDIYENDPIPANVDTGRLMNGADFDTYFKYISDVDGFTNNQPMAIWQIPGASLQVEGAPCVYAPATPNVCLSGTWPDYVFGHTGLNPDMSNLASNLGIPGILFTAWEQTNVYYTTVPNAQVYLMQPANNS